MKIVNCKLCLRRYLYR